eukprot:gene12261-biopygen3348
MSRGGYSRAKSSWNRSCRSRAGSASMAEGSEPDLGNDGEETGGVREDSPE